MNLNKIFNNLNKTVGKIASDVNFDIYRPDYTAADQVGTLIYSGMSVRFDTRAAQWAEPSLSEGMYYDLFLDRLKVQEGDILIPVGLSPTASTVSRYPVMTVASISALKPCLGFLTDHLGQITEDVNTVVYNNVRWQWTSKGTPRNGRNRNIAEDILPYDKRQALMYRRQGTGQPTAIIPGQRLVETVDGREHWWTILDVYSVGNFTTMQLEEDSR